MVMKMLLLLSRLLVLMLVWRLLLIAARECLMLESLVVAECGPSHHTLPPQSLRLLPLKCNSALSYQTQL